MGFRWFHTKIALIAFHASPKMKLTQLVWGSVPMGDETLIRLAAVIAAREEAAPGSSYTKSLLDKGPAGCAKKFGEEAFETVIAVISENDDRVISETADLLYHLMVLLQSRKVSIERVFQELKQREGTSGLAEKASRLHDGRGL